jgi:acyl carrier protein
MADTAIVPKLLEILKSDLAVVATEDDLNADLIRDLGFDSVTFAIGRVAIQERIGVDMSEELLLSCNTLQDVVGLIEKLQSENKG